VAISNIVPYEGDLGLGYVIQPADWNGSFDNITNYINTTLVPTINGLLGSVSGLPAGSITAWFGTSNVPAGWALCNGQSTTWLTGPNAGSGVTVPNLIGMFIQGGDITGGSSAGNTNGFGSQGNQTQQGSKTQTHTFTVTSGVDDNNSGVRNDVGQINVAAQGHHHTVSGTTDPSNLQPPCYVLVYIMKL
jgi:hypothetical protein